MKRTLALLTLLCISCAGGVKTIRIREGFLYDTFSKKNLYLAPAVNRSKVRTLEHSEVLLEKVFRGERRDLPVQGAGYTLSRLDARGKGLLNGLLWDLRCGTSPKAGAVRELSGALGLNYVVVPVIESFQMSQYETREELPIREERGRGADSVTVYTDSVSSSIHGSLHVFNLATGELDLYLQHERSIVVSDSHSERGCLDGFFYHLFNEPPTPEDPSAVAEALFTDMVESLPERGDTIGDCLERGNCRLLD
ncbi:MAG: hypothetical protein JXA20_01345 [Spirochaetes bacterium]|nr:hypothetical protein [Spirochaetota bacterium]